MANVRGLPSLLLLMLIGCAPSSSPKAANVRAEASPSPGTLAGTAAAPAIGQTPASSPAPAAVSAAVAPAPPRDTLEEITFEDIQLPIQADMVLRPFMLTQRVKDLDGKKIRISGYMLPDVKTKGITQFVLLKNTQCKFGPGGQADHLLNVLMVDGATAKFRADAISVEGVLKINPFQGPDGNTWSIYDLAGERVEAYRPRR